jgi:nicotinamidase-related amidase
MERVLPNIVALAEFNPARMILTRFIPPLRWEDRPGRWQRYFKKWERTTRSQLRASALDVVPSLARFAPPATVVDKPAYSAFVQSSLANVLSNGGVDALIVTGAETDVCVLSSVLDAVDIGFRVIVVEDGLCSSSDEGHEALMTIYRTRFSEQIELMMHSEVIGSWQDR